MALADEVLPRLRSTERGFSAWQPGVRGGNTWGDRVPLVLSMVEPALDAFRAQWPGVALDLSAAFSFAPLPTLVRGGLDLVITSDPQALEAVTYLPLFKFELGSSLCWRYRHPIL